MSDQTKGLAALLAAQGRNGDTELVHVNKRELSALEQLGRRHGIETTTNPHTGLKEAYNWGSTIGGVLGGIGGVFAAPFTGGVINPYTGAALGSAAGTAIGGGTAKEALVNGMISGATAYAGAGIADSLAQTGAEAAKTGVTEGVKTGVEQSAQSATPNLFSQAGQPGGAPNLFSQAAGNTPLTSTTPIPGGPLASLQPTGAGPVAPLGENFTSTLPKGGFAEVGANPADKGILSPESTQKLAMDFQKGVPQDVAKTPANTLSESGSTGKYWSNVGKGLDTTTSSPASTGKFLADNKGSLIATGLGAYATGADLGADQTTDTAGLTPNNTMKYKGEVYYTPTGERRTRAVPLARGGDVYGDYDGADEAPDGGYHPGGGLNYAGGGGIGFIQSIQPGGKWGDITSDAYGVVDKNMPGTLRDITPGGFMGATMPGQVDWKRKQADAEQRKKYEEAAGIAAAAKAKQTADFNSQWSDRYGAPVTMAAGGPAQDDNVVHQIVQNAYGQQNQQERMPLLEYLAGKTSGDDVARYYQERDSRNSMEHNPVIRHIAGLPPEQQQNMARGGISALGHYSDGGQMLRGPGDGVSDSIPASIEGKRPARLADGEFVIPARAVSELGNGSTEAGSKQLYAMLDRIAAKRKKGKGLAYQANPKKILPV